MIQYLTFAVFSFPIVDDGDIERAKYLARELKNSKRFYNEMSQKCRENYKKSLYNEKNFTPYIEKIFERI